MGDRDYLSTKPSRRPLLGAVDNTLIKLIAINAFVFIILKFLLITYQVSYDTTLIGGDFFAKQILNWFVLPAQVDKLFTRPWVLLSYMFSNVNVLMFVGNMLWLFSFGHILQDMAGNKKLIPIYLYGGFFGALAYILSANLLPSLSQQIDTFPPLIGSAAAIMAVAVATTTFAPDYRIFPLISGGIPLWVLTVAFVAVDFISIARQNLAEVIAHLIAAAVGFLFVKQLGKDRDMGAWMNSFGDWFINLFNPDKTTKARKERNFYKVEKPPFEKTPNVTQQRLDAILDKINQHGYAMLTDEEKIFLKRASKEEL